MNDKSVSTRKGLRERRPPPVFNASEPPPAGPSGKRARASLLDAKEERAARASKALKAKEQAAPRTAVPSEADPTAFVRASQNEVAPHFLPFYPTIELDTGVKVKQVPDWLRKQAPSDAALGRQYVGRLLGKISLKVECQEPVHRRLFAAHSVKFTKIQSRPRILMKTWDEDGEFSSRTREHVPVSRLLDSITSGLVKSCAVVAASSQPSPSCSSPAPAAAAAAGAVTPAKEQGESGTVRAAPSALENEALELLQHVYALQSPQSSPWKRPMLRALSTNVSHADGFTVTYYIYTSRLLFELIADPAISGLMKSLEPVAHVTPAAVIEEQPVQFISTRPCLQSSSSSDSSAAEADGDGNGDEGGDDSSSVAAARAQREYDFSLAGILKSAESCGYRIVDPQPADLMVDLFEFQRSSCQWMLDHERDPRGLNGYFWEKREWADGGPPLWYFPLAGEFRLAEPPHITGGLLCEEMGLGKTMEVLSTILANPRDGGSHSTREHRRSLREGHEWLHWDSAKRVVSRATLIVVPVSLVGQWAEEIRKNSRPGALRVLTLAGPLERRVPLSEITLLGANHYGPASGMQQRFCMAPCYAPGETANSRTGGRAFLAGPWIIRGVADLTADQARRIEARQQLDYNDNNVFRNLQAAPAPAPAPAPAAAGDGEEVETARVVFRVDHRFVADNDVVLTTYELLRRKPALFRKINFHRCVLDECQEIKTATTNIAKMCQQVKACHRWMVSGTPIAGKIDSLHGELNFLQVWPFSLQNDGFWEKKVGEPFEAKDDRALELLRALIRVIMMRHSKSQTYLDGRPLVKIPARTVEWRGVEFSSAPEFGQYANPSAPHARYVYKYLENLCATVCRKMEESAARASGAGEAEANGMGRRDFMKLKSLLTLMQRASTHPGLVNLGQLDVLKRSVRVDAPRLGQLWMPGQFASSGGTQGGSGAVSQVQANVEAELKARADAIETLPAEEVLRRLAQKGAGNMGGLNRDVNRNWAVGGEAEMKLRDSLEAMPLTELQHRLEAEGLPLPRSWAILKPKADIATGSVDLRFGPAPALLAQRAAGAGEVDDAGSDSGSANGKGKRKRSGAEAEAAAAAADRPGLALASTAATSPPTKFDVRKLLKVSDTIRVGVNSEDYESTVESVGESSATLNFEWMAGPIKAGSVYRFSISTRRKPFVDLLVASDKAKKETEVQVAGFSAIYKAMAGEPVNCPICMCSVVRPTVTKCAHLFCRECISRELQRTPAIGMAQPHQSKCPICRRTMKGSEMMELQTLSEVEEAVALDATAEDSGGRSGRDARSVGGEGEGVAAARAGGSDGGGGGSKGKGRGKENAIVEEPEADGGGRHPRRHEDGTVAAEGGALGIGASANGVILGGGGGGGGDGGSSTSDEVSASASGGAVDLHASRGGSGQEFSGGRESAAVLLPVSAAGRGAAATAAGLSAGEGRGARAPGAGSGAGSGGDAAGATRGEDENVVVGPSLLIPTFRVTATATAAQLSNALAPPINSSRDPAYPSLETSFLSQYRAATSSRSSVKLDALVRDMDTALLHDPSSKFVIFSQYPQVVDRTGQVLLSRGVRSTSIVGGRSRVERSSAVSSFTNDPDIRVILLTTGSAAAGLTLTAASTVYMLDPVWSAADEAQALNRAHRIGQAHSVRCVVFYMKDSVEERLLALRHSKGNFAQFLESADSVVSLAPEGANASSGSFVNLFALPELKKLFGMVGSQTAGDVGVGAGAGGSRNLSGSVRIGRAAYDDASSSDDSVLEIDEEENGGRGRGVRDPERDSATAIALSRALSQARRLEGGSGGGGGAGSPFDLTST